MSDDQGSRIGTTKRAPRVKKEIPRSENNEGVGAGGEGGARDDPYAAAAAAVAKGEKR